MTPMTRAQFYTTVLPGPPEELVQVAFFILADPPFKVFSNGTVRILSREEPYETLREIRLLQTIAQTAEEQKYEEVRNLGQKLEDLTQEEKGIEERDVPEETQNRILAAHDRVRQATPMSLHESQKQLQGIIRESHLFEQP